MNSLLLVLLALAVVALIAVTACWAAAEGDLAAVRKDNRALSDQARGYQADTSRMARRITELRDQLDVANGTADEPTLTEAWTAFMAEFDVTFPEDQR
ncbi:hypothetical protein AB0C44_08020 [Micromonospora taraxaci]|uniref:hypothetical protein n=1 Tax=Micromonospora taraxaci TaxID=1316803 RepID=UPI0033E4ABD1